MPSERHIASARHALYKQMHTCPCYAEGYSCARCDAAADTLIAAVRSAVLAEDNLSVVESVVGLMKHRYRHLLPDDHMRELVDEAKDVLDRRAAVRRTALETTDGR